MEILDNGHTYRVAELDGETTNNILQFVKRSGIGYPGNVGTQAGTNCQELLRVLIDRVQYLDSQIHHASNDACIDYLRRTLWHLENRAAERHSRALDVDHLVGIEQKPFCNVCGHIHMGCCGNDH